MTGRFIGNYRIVDYIGSGAFGSVFRAEDVNSPGRIVAIKELHKRHTRNSVIKQRFFQEAVAMARLDHPNLPRLHTFGEDNGSYYLVMEFISGRLLTDEIQARGKLEPSPAIAIVRQVLEAVNYAHSNGIIHRDLKPDNIILAHEEPPRVKVLDFGIARMVGGENLTMTGEGFGTPAYMSPERINGLRAVDHRTDIYSVGIILVEMLTGQPPFQSTSTDPARYWAEMRAMHESQELPPLASLRVPVELDHIVRKAAAKQVEDRYQSAADMLEELKALSEGEEPAETAPDSVRLVLTTVPAGAEVWVGDTRRGVSDQIRGRLFIDGLAPGLHNVRVTKAGYNEYRISVALEAGQQTDLQVALAARATVAIPPHIDATAPVDVRTQRIEPTGDELKTALLVVESLPPGSTVFVGTKAAALADENGRATLKLTPGAHEIQVSTPSGQFAKSSVTVTDRETGSLRTITLPMASAAPTAQPVVVRRAPPPTNRRFATAAVALLLVGLAVATYFVVRSQPRLTDQTDSQGQIGQEHQGIVPHPDGEEQADSKPIERPQPEEKPEPRQPSEEKPSPSKDEKKPRDADKAPTETPSPATPAETAKQPEPTQTQQQAGAPESETCMAVLVTSAEGEPVPRLRVAFMVGPDAAYHGQTNERGRWFHCGLKPGHSVKVVVFGPAGGVLASRPVVVSPGKNFVPLRVGLAGARPSDVSPKFEPRPGPKRRPPFLRRPDR
jgi:tRNA A-37 threonylcarbamoyl transferase component Bud32